MLVLSYPLSSPLRFYGVTTSIKRNSDVKVPSYDTTRPQTQIYEDFVPQSLVRP